MSLRISSALLAGAVLAPGCAPAAPPPPGEAIACALGRAAAFAKACTLEREDAAGRFVLHHPGGEFRRFSRDPQTGAVMSADGAERVSDQASAGEYLSFALGENRYRVPLRLLESAS